MASPSPRNPGAHNPAYVANHDHGMDDLPVGEGPGKIPSTVMVEGMVEEAVLGTAWKPPVDLSTLGLGPIVLSPAPANVDGVALVAGMRVGVVDQGDATNGIYEFDGADLVRTPDFDTGAFVDSGTKFYVRDGVANNTKTVRLEAPVTPVTVGVTVTTWAEDTGGGGGGETLAQTLAIGNVTGGNDIIVDATDEIRGAATANGDGLRFMDVGSAAPTLAYGNNAITSAQWGWLIGGDNVTVNAAADFGAGPSIVWAEDVSIPANTPLAWMDLRGNLHTIGANAYIEYSYLNGSQLVLDPNAYIGYSLVLGSASSQITSAIETCIVTLANTAVIDVATNSLLVLDACHVVNSFNGVVIGANHRFEPTILGVALGNGTWTSNRNEFLFASQHTIATTDVGAFQAGMSTQAARTTTAAVTEMTVGRTSAAVIREIMRASSVRGFKVLVSAYQTGGAAGAAGDSATWEFSGQIRRDGANNTTLGYCVVQQQRDLALNGGGNVLAHVGIDASGGAVAPSGSLGGGSGWFVQVDANDANEALRIRVTGEANKNITWLARITWAEAGAGTAL